MRLGDPVLASETRPLLEAAFMAVHSLSPVASGCKDESSPSIRAATPETCGHAIEVPDIVAIAALDRWPAEVMLTPGPKMSKHLP